MLVNIFIKSQFKQPMRYFAISALLILGLTNIIYCQQNTDPQRFAKVDAHVANVHKQLIFQPERLANKLTEGFTNDYDKVRAFYVWIAYNIEYDFTAYSQNKHVGQSVNEVLTSGKALCLGYSLLFDFFCEIAGIPCEVIDGYAKGIGYKKNQEFRESNHAWNAVNIYGSWYLLDVTWANGDTQNRSLQHKKINLEEHFLVPAEKFILSHLPEDPSWQLMKNKVSMSEFESGQKTTNNEAAEINNFNPEDYADLNEFDKELLKCKRASHFNPKNSILFEHLSFAFVYKAISITDELYKIPFNSLLDTLYTIDSMFSSFLDSAVLIIEPIENWKISSFKMKLKDEINYQKGVFYYEIGAELFRKVENQENNLMEINKKTSNYFDLAARHFTTVPDNSIYHQSASEYLTNIENYRKRELDYFSPN